MNDKDIMGMVYISEQTTPEDATISNVNHVSRDGLFYVEFDACLQSFGVMNRNNRQYIGSNVWENIQTEKIQSLLADNAWYGEMDHPAPNFKGQEFTPERVQRIEMSRRSHKIMRPRMEGNLLMAHIQTVAGTDCGVGMAKDILQGLNPRFSARALATMKMDGGKPTVMVHRLITYDWVLFQSHREAGKRGPSTTVNKPIINGAITESAGVYYGDQHYSSGDQFIALKEMLEYTGKHDVNTQMICESFDMDTDNIIGLTRDNRKCILKKHNNIIYANVDPYIAERISEDISDLF